MQTANGWWRLRSCLGPARDWIAELRAIVLPMLVAALATFGACLWYDGITVELLPGEISLPPYPRGVLVARPPAAELPLAELRQLRDSIRCAPSELEALRRLARGLQPGDGQPAVVPPLPAWLPRTPLSLEETLFRRKRGKDVDQFSVANLALQVAVASGLTCRLVVGRSADLWSPKCFAGLEVWSAQARRWLVMDPAIGVLQRDLNGMLSAIQVHRRLPDDLSISPYPLLERLPLVSGSSLAAEYVHVFTELLVPTAAHAADVEAGRYRWAVLGPSLVPCRQGVLAAASSSTALALALAYLLLAELGQLAGRSLGLAGPARLPDLVRADLKRIRNLLTRPPSWLTRPMARFALLTQPVRAELEPLSTPLVAIGALALVATALLTTTALLNLTNLEDDAYITFRYARNLAAGYGPTFNAGEAPIEGFSNTLWLAMLAAALRVTSDPYRIALGLGLALALAHLFVLALISRRLGLRSWPALLVLATNANYAGACTSGLETSLVALLTTLVAWSWLEEDDTGRGADRTAILCFLLTLARADGFFLFLVLSACRICRLVGLGEARGLLAWFEIYLVPCTFYLAGRWAIFGSVVPWIYQSRIVLTRGGLLDRVIPGLRYDMVCLAANPALALGALAFLALTSQPPLRRLAVIPASQLLLNAVTGGDAHYLLNSRFLMPASGSLALFGSALASKPPGRRLPLFAAAWITLLVCGNCLKVEQPQFELRPEWNGLERFVRAARAFLAGGTTAAEAELAEVQRNFARTTFDCQVGRDLASTLPPSDTLACGSAGELGWYWPGRFRDILGLIEPALFPFGRAVRHADWWLLWPTSFAWRIGYMRYMGLRLDRLYIYTKRHDKDFGIYALLSRAPEGLYLSDDLFDRTTELLLPWRVPASRRIVFCPELADEPIFDGPAGKQRGSADLQRIVHLANCLADSEGAWR